MFDILSRNSTEIYRNSTFVSICFNYRKIPTSSHWALKQIFAELYFVFHYDFQIKLSSNMLKLSPNLTYLLIADSKRKTGEKLLLSSYTLINLKNR